MTRARQKVRGRTGEVMLGLALLCAGPACAVADPRSDALAGAGRCQVIADDRTFLNCLYGAMQPLRAELGLAPALPAQTSLVPPATLPMAPPPAAARLAPPPSAGTPPPPRNDGLVADVFGGKTEVAPQRLTGFDFDRNGFFTVTLADGTVWKQLDGDTARAHWHGAPGMLAVTIRSGAFGAHVLSVRGEATSYKVMRVR